MAVKGNYLFFWRQASYLSNWHTCYFTIDGITFNCIEQWMMYAKAILFNDTEIAQEILNETDPYVQKMYGREVRNFKKDVWDKEGFDIVVAGLIEKFNQNQELKDMLLATNDLHIVEASPVDFIWGIGMAENHPDIMDKSKWKGQNLLGEALMKTRSIIRGN